MITKISLLLTAIIEIYCANMFFGIFSKERLSKPKHITTLVMLAFVHMINSYFRVEILVFVVGLLIFFCVALLFELRLIHKVILTIVISVDITLCEYLLVGVLFIVFGKNYVDIIQDEFVYSMGCLLSKFFLYITVLVVSMIYNKRHSYIADKKSIPLMLILPVSTVVMVIILQSVVTEISSQTHKLIYFVFVVLMFFANIINFILLERQSNIAKARAEIEFMKSNVEAQEKYYNSILKSHEEIIKLKHDIKNFYIAAIAEIDSGRTDELKSNILDNLNVINSSRPALFTGHPAIDSVIQSKLIICDEDDIKTNIQYFYKESLNINEMDIAVILGNLFDNAIESNLKIDENRYINGLISVDNNEINISITNPIIESNPNLKTTKSNAIEHGYGIKSITGIAQKYSGTARFNQLDKRFEAYVILLNKGE